MQEVAQVHKKSLTYYSSACHKDTNLGADTQFENPCVSIYLWDDQELMKIM